MAIDLLGDRLENNRDVVPLGSTKSANLEWFNRQCTGQTLAVQKDNDETRINTRSRHDGTALSKIY